MGNLCRTQTLVSLGAQRAQNVGGAVQDLRSWSRTIHVHIMDDMSIFSHISRNFALERLNRPPPLSAMASVCCSRKDGAVSHEGET
jgi:hypothetical protein